MGECCIRHDRTSMAWKPDWPNGLENTQSGRQHVLPGRRTDKHDSLCANLVAGKPIQSRRSRECSVAQRTERVAQPPNGVAQPQNGVAQRTERVAQLPNEPDLSNILFFVVSIEKTRFYALISGARSGSSVQWPTSATSATRNDLTVRQGPGTARLVAFCQPMTTDIPT